MENVNHDIACHVNKCKYNYHGRNCTLEHITVGCGCDTKSCTCCESYKEEV